MFTGLHLIVNRIKGVQLLCKFKVDLKLRSVLLTKLI